MISMDKQYQTRDGRPVRLLCVDGNDPNYPVVGFVGDNVGISKWTHDGLYNIAEPCINEDLVEVKETKVVKSLCWRSKNIGCLVWGDEKFSASGYQRFPAGDIEGEVEDD